MKTHERKWLGAWGGSLLIHAGVVGVAALAGLLVSSTGGGCGLLTVELGGPGGMAGGLGDKQHEGQKGDGGANASGADVSAPGESDESPPQTAAPNTEFGDEGLVPNQTAAPPAENVQSVQEQIEPTPEPEPVAEAVPEPMPEPEEVIQQTTPEQNTDLKTDPESVPEQEKPQDPPQPPAEDALLQEKTEGKQKPETAVKSSEQAEQPKKAAPEKQSSTKPKSTEKVKKAPPSKREETKKKPESSAKQPVKREPERTKTVDPKKTTPGSGLGNDQRPQTKKLDDGSAEGKGTRNVGGAAGAAGSSGSAFSQGSDTGSGLGQGRGDLVGDGAFRDNGDGTFSARGGGGFRYRILYEEPARYPKQARTLGYDKKVAVRVRFLVDETGRVEKTVVISKKVPKLGFEEAALRSISKMEFEPIRLRGKPIKVWFVKTIHFSPG